MPKEQLKLFPDKVKGYANVLLDASKIAKDRQDQYGSAVESVQLACDIAKIAFGIDLTVKQFCDIMVSLKLSRLKFKYKEDSMIDCVNYLSIGIQSERENEQTNSKNK